MFFKNWNRSVFKLFFFKKFMICYSELVFFTVLWHLLLRWYLYHFSTSIWIRFICNFGLSKMINVYFTRCFLVKIIIFLLIHSLTWVILKSLNFFLLVLWRHLWLYNVLNDFSECCFWKKRLPSHWNFYFDQD